VLLEGFSCFAGPKPGRLSLLAFALFYSSIWTAWNSSRAGGFMETVHWALLDLGSLGIQGLTNTYSKSLKGAANLKQINGRAKEKLINKITRKLGLISFKHRLFVL
jgi:hypothetical protein